MTSDAEKLFHTIYRHSRFMDRDTWWRRNWISGVEEFKEQIVATVLEEVNNQYYLIAKDSVIPGEGVKVQ